MKNKFLIICSLPFVLSACAEKQQATPATEAPEEAVATIEETADDAAAALPRSASIEGARVFFISPADGDAVSNPVRVVFGIEGMDVVPAGDDAPHSGHHHLLIDTELPDLGLPIPADDHHVHFGDGSTETEITLEPGQHTLQMLLGDHLHIPHDPPVASGVITIVVE